MENAIKGLENKKNMGKNNNACYKFSILIMRYIVFKIESNDFLKIRYVGDAAGSKKYCNTRRLVNHFL